MNHRAPAARTRPGGPRGGAHGGPASSRPTWSLPAEQGTASDLVPAAALAAATAADDKLGQDTVVLGMTEQLGVVDAFVVTSGRNARQVRTLVEEIEARVKSDGGPSPTSVEGLRDGTWVLMDYGDFIVHVFLEETRAFYDLEHLWAGAPRLDWRAAVGSPA